FERTRDDVRRVVGDHRPEFSAAHEFDRLAAEAGREHAIEAGRRTAALQVPKNHRTRLFFRFPRERLAYLRADAAETLGEPFARLLDERRRTAARVGPFCRHDDAELRPVPVARAEAF